MYVVQARIYKKELKLITIDKQWQILNNTFGLMISKSKELKKKTYVPFIEYQFWIFELKTGYLN